MASEASQYKSQIGNVSTIYNLYRILLPVILLLTRLSSPAESPIGLVSPSLFILVAVVYAIFGVATTLITRLFPGFIFKQRYQILTLLFDVLMVTTIAYTSGGVVSGLTLLLIVTVASSSMLMRGRLSTFIAAVATIAVIYGEAYLSLSLDDYTGQFIQAGILGCIFFAISLYIQSVNHRAFQAALLAEERANNIIGLEKLNNEIIQRMRTGIMVVNPEQQIVTMNNAALSLLKPLLKTSKADSEYQLPEVLAQQISAWRDNPYNQGDPIKVPATSTILQTNFALLNNTPTSDVLVFIENQNRVMQRIRQTKLASLGRLTANIAHEIRNPLGAISHAGQILSESEDLEKSDQRLLDIILDHCNRVNRIIEDVLDASRHNDVSPNTILLQDWLDDFVRNYRETHNDCDDIATEYDNGDVEVRVITSQLERVLTNLFDNGLRYSRKAGNGAKLRIKAGLKSGISDYQMPYISVIDFGPALDEEAQSQLFEPFHTTEASGTGLGLYISKELCEANQATLDYSATEEGTSCFSIHFSNSSQPSV